MTPWGVSRQAPALGSLHLHHEGPSLVHVRLEPSTCSATAQTSPPKGHSAVSWASGALRGGGTLPDHSPLTHALFRRP